MNKREIISILRQNINMEDILDYGPTALLISEGKKTFLMHVARKENYIKVSTGNILRRTIRIPISEIVSN